MRRPLLGILLTLAFSLLPALSTPEAQPRRFVDLAALELQALSLGISGQAA
jgi:hypothetical protein